MHSASSRCIGSIPATRQSCRLNARSRLAIGRTICPAWCARAAMNACVSHWSAQRARLRPVNTPCSIRAIAVSAAASSRVASIQCPRPQREESLIILFFRWRGHDGQLQGANDAQGRRTAIRYLESRGAEVDECGPPALLVEGTAREPVALRGLRQCDEGGYRGAAQVGAEGAAES